MKKLILAAAALLSLVVLYKVTSQSVSGTKYSVTFAPTDAQLAGLDDFVARVNVTRAKNGQSPWATEDALLDEMNAFASRLANEMQASKKSDIMQAIADDPSILKPIMDTISAQQKKSLKMPVKIK